jgi:ABC-2 type transport system permease protein
MFNPNLDGVWFGGVMEVLNQVTLISIILTGAALIREREHGTLEHLMVMPLSPFQIMTAKVWANGLVVLLLTLRLVVQGWLGTDRARSRTGGLRLLFSTTSIRILLATIVRGIPQLGLLIILVVLPFLVLSGAVTHARACPGDQSFMLSARPLRFVSLAQAILTGVPESTWCGRVLRAVAIGTVAFVGALARFRRSVSLV